MEMTRRALAAGWVLLAASATWAVRPGTWDHKTEADFNATLDMLRQVQFHRIQVFGYSDRAGTLAASMKPKVPRETIDNRLRRVRDAFPERCACVI